jgi:tyrosinase
MGRRRGIHMAAKGLSIALLALFAAACATVPTRPTETLPLVDVQVNNSPTHIDDYASAFANVPSPARIRIANPQSGTSGVQADVPVVLSHIGACGMPCGQIRFGATASAAATPTLALVLPKSGAWVPFVVRGVFGASSLRPHDAVLEVRENRPDGIVLARLGVDSSDHNQIIPPQLSAIVEIGREGITLDDYLGWSPTAATVRLALPNSQAGPLAVTLRNSPIPVWDTQPRGQVLFGLPVGSAPPPVASMTPTLPLVLPSNGDPVAIYVAGQFGQASIRDKDAVIEVAAPHPVFPTAIVPIEQHNTMVRIRKNGQNLSVNERDRLLTAIARLDAAVGGYAKFVTANGLAGARAYSGNTGFTLASPAFLPWHRLFILRFERELQGLDPSVALPYWRYDQPAPVIFAQDFMGVRQTGAPVVTSTSNPLHGWGIVRASAFAPNQSPTSLAVPAACRPMTEAATLALGGKFRDNSFGVAAGFMSMEWKASDVALHAAAGDCAGTTGWLANAGTAARDPLFFLLYANTDRLWAKWQRQAGRFDPALPDSYGIVACGLPAGQCIADPMWPWNDLSAPGGRFPEGLGRFLTPPPQPAPSDALGLDHSYLPNGPGQWTKQAVGLGYSYDDVPPAP